MSFPNTCHTLAERFADLAGRETDPNVRLLLQGIAEEFAILASEEAFQTDDNTGANNTRLLLWDITDGSWQRVSIGANDSESVGYRNLRVPNP